MPLLILSPNAASSYMGPRGGLKGASAGFRAVDSAAGA